MLGVALKRGSVHSVCTHFRLQCTFNPVASPIESCVERVRVSKPLAGTSRMTNSFEPGVKT